MLTSGSPGSKPTRTYPSFSRSSTLRFTSSGLLVAGSCESCRCCSFSPSTWSWSANSELLSRRPSSPALVELSAGLPAAATDGCADHVGCGIWVC